MAEWNFRLRAKLDDRGQVSKMITEQLEKDWAEWDAEHPYEPHPRDGHSGIAGGQHDARGESVDLHGKSDPMSDAIKSDDPMKSLSGSYRDQQIGMQESGAKDEMNAVNTYQQAGGYSAINGPLRGDSAMSPKSADLISSMDSSFEHGSTTSSDVQVYRGVGSADWGTNVKAGDVVADSGFASTTLEKSRAEGFAGDAGPGGGWLMNVTVPAGQSYVLGNPRETEMILPRGTAMQVNSIDHASKEVTVHVVK